MREFKLITVFQAMSKKFVFFFICNVMNKQFFFHRKHEIIDSNTFNALLKIDRSIYATHE